LDLLFTPDAGARGRCTRLPKYMDFMQVRHPDSALLFVFSHLCKRGPACFSHARRICSEQDFCQTGGDAGGENILRRNCGFPAGHRQ